MRTLEMSVLRILSVNTIFTEKNEISIRKNRASAAIVLKWEGETVYTDCKGMQVLSNATHPVFLPKGSCYEWRCCRAGRYTIVEFDTDFICEEIWGLTYTNVERLRQHLHALELECLHKKPHWRLRASGAVYEILYELLTAGEGEYTPSEKLEKIRPAVEYMTEHYNEELSNEALARMTDISTVYFRKIFTSAYGMPPMRYLHLLRIQKAKEMLRSDYGSLANVAASVGYPNVFHFSKAFKQIVGISPGAYAKGT